MQLFCGTAGKIFIGCCWVGGVVPEPPPNAFFFIFKFTGAGDAMQVCRTGCSSYLWCCLHKIVEQFRKDPNEKLAGLYPSDSWFCGKAIGFLCCWMHSVVFQSRCKGVGAVLQVGCGTGRPRNLMCCPWASSQRAPRQAVCPILPPPMQVTGQLQLSHSLTLLAAQLQQDVVIYKDGASRKFLPPPPGVRRKPKQSHDWVTPESLRTRFLGWCWAPQPCCTAGVSVRCCAAAGRDGRETWEAVWKEWPDWVNALL